MRLLLPGASLVLLAASTVALANSTAKPITRDYDIRSIAVVTTDVADEPDLSVNEVVNGPATRPAPSRPNRPDALTQIMQRVESLLPAGPATTVTEENGILHVTASAEDQARVGSAIHAWSAAQSVDITIETRVLYIDHDAIARFDPQVRTLLDNIPVTNAGEIIDAKQLRAVLGAIANSNAAEIVTAPRVTLFQNQKAYVEVATRTPYISDFLADKSNSAVYKPIIRDAVDGIVVGLRANAAGDGSAIALDYHIQISNLIGMNKGTWTDPVSHEKRSIDLPDARTQTIAQLASIAPGHALLTRMPHPVASTLVSNGTHKADQDGFVILTAATVDSAGLKHPR